MRRSAFPSTRRRGERGDNAEKNLLSCLSPRFLRVLRASALTPPPLPPLLLPPLDQRHNHTLHRRLDLLQAPHPRHSLSNPPRRSLIRDRHVQAAAEHRYVP